MVRKADGKWVSIKIMQEPVKALTQSYRPHQGRATTRHFRQETMDLHTNSSNNTIYADAGGNIAYFHGNFIPKRDTRFDWTKPVDGSDPATEWKGLLSVDESPHYLLNPASGWLYNTNNWPWSAAGPSSPKKADYPVYVETGGESARGLHAIRVLQNTKDFTVNSLDRGGVRQLSPRLRGDDPAAGQVVRRARRRESAQGEAIGADGAPARLGLPLVGHLGPDVAGRLLGRGDRPPRGRRCPQGRDPRRRVHRQERDGRARVQALAVASDKLEADFGSWKNAVGATSIATSA